MHFNDQFRLPKEDDEENINLALRQYKAEFLFIRPYTMSYNKLEVNAEIIDNKIKFMIAENSVKITLNDVVNFCFKNKDYTDGFLVEYERYLNGEIWRKPDYLHPNLEGLPVPAKSYFRNLIDGYLVEIRFDGWVKIKEIKGNYSYPEFGNLWKVEDITPQDKEIKE